MKSVGNYLHILPYAYSGMLMLHGSSRSFDNNIMIRQTIMARHGLFNYCFTRHHFVGVSLRNTCKPIHRYAQDTRLSQASPSQISDLFKLMIVLCTVSGPNIGPARAAPGRRPMCYHVNKSISNSHLLISGQCY